MERKLDIGVFVDSPTIQSVTSSLVERVKERRKEKGLTQSELARLSGVSYSSIKRFERMGEISLSSLIKISNAIGCLLDFEELFKNKIITNLKDYK